MSSSQIPESHQSEKSTGARGRFAAVGNAAKRRGRDLVAVSYTHLEDGGRGCRGPDLLGAYG